MAVKGLINAYTTTPISNNDGHLINRYTGPN